jgi:predicted DNA-binding transcriptional regulator AlpA
MGTLPNTTIHLLNEYQVAEMLALSVATVRRWRLLRQGPKYIKIGAAVRYKPVDLTAWLASRPTGGERSALTESH